MSRILPMLWAGFGAFLTLGAVVDLRAFFAAIVIGGCASVAEVWRDG